MSINEDVATSFGAVADNYDRVRPGPPAEALDWLVPAGCGLAVDLAAGTGLFTRALLGRAGQVTAVEPDARMRAVLAQQSPQVRVLAGRGEEMPLPDGCADALFVSTAWHWLDPDRAVPEIARVLRPGGRLGVIWTSRDRQPDWVAELDLLRLPGIDGPATADTPRTPDEVRDWLDRHNTVTLPPGAEFTRAEAASFRFIRTLAVDDVLEWLATNSAFITASAADRAAGLDRCRAALLSQTGGADVIEMPMRSWCWRAERAGRRLPKVAGQRQNSSSHGCEVGTSPTICMWQRSTAARTAVSRGSARCRRTEEASRRMRRAAPGGA
jgi:SAM-dependent methyltransferase